MNSNINLARFGMSDLANKHGIKGVFLHAVPHPTNPDDVSFVRHVFDGRKNKGTN